MRNDDLTTATNADAIIRARRSLFSGLLIDVAVTVILVLATSFGDIQWTKTYWVTLGLLLAKSVLQSVVAYFLRKLVPPANA